MDIFIERDIFILYSHIFTYERVIFITEGHNFTLQNRY